ncbi:MAG: 4'-phosphopantetheinyl transferase superfamily protein [Alphaproteobacteria bacterium]
MLSRYGSLPPEAWRFSATKFGRPFVVDDDPALQDLRFNLSHSGDTVIMGVSRGAEIGIDVEDLNRNVPLEIATSYFTADEVQQLKALPPEQQPRRFLELWTLKESYIKARGKGLSIPLDQFGFDLSAGDRLTAHFDSSLHPQQTRWRFWQWQPCSGSIAALCVEDTPGMNWQVKARAIIPFVLEEETAIVMERAS